MSSDIPPSYGSAEQLPQYEIDVPVFNAQIPAMTAEQRVAFKKAVAKTMTSPDAAEYLKAAAVDASNACNTITIMLIDLMNKLAKIDAENMPPKEDPFVPRFKLLSQEYHAIVHESRDLADKIAVYGQRFGRIIVPYCNDESIPTKARLAKVTEFIEDADTFCRDSDSMKYSFEQLRLDFAVFTGSFSGWAPGKEGDTKELERMREDLKELKNEISKLNGLMTTSGCLTLGSELVAGTLAVMSGPFAPFVITGALTIAGLGSTTGIKVAIDSKINQFKAKQARIDTLVQSIRDMKVTREKLKLLGMENLEHLNKNISLIALLWTSAHHEAKEIKTWLEGGAKDVVSEHNLPRLFLNWR
ncbi:hypothetical protein DFH11DRAFT_1785928 [Phellopilus nigrolimitatus]|nr:hypothetical protein DFH11DRAFT_1785928 [Phellopilus nigrolimitatus]